MDFVNTVLIPNNGMLLDVIQYSNSRILAGLVFDSDIYVPCDKNFQQLDINRDRILAYNLACEIQKELTVVLNDAITHNQVSQNKLNQFFQFFILERQGINQNRTNEDEQGNLYVRFGYHIYFPHILIKEENKKILKDILNKDLSKFYQQNIAKIYKTTGVSEWFDPQPFCGTTSIPLTFPDTNKCYTKFLLNNNGTIVAIPVIQRQDLMLELDMFNGHEFEIKSQFLQNVRLNTLTSLIFKYQCQNYKTALLQAYRELTQKKLANKQIIDICVQFNHIRDVFIRSELIKLLYQYFNHDEYITQLAYFIAMAGDDYISMQDVLALEQEIINEVQTQLQNSILSTTQNTQIEDNSNVQNPIFEWIQSMKERDRAPIKAQALVQKVVTNYDRSQEKTDPLINIIELFNKNVQFKVNNNMITQEAAVYYKQTTGIYDDFMKYKQICYNGILDDIDLEEMKAAEFKSFFLQFLNYKLRNTLNTYVDKQRNRLLFSFNDSDDQQDIYHFRKIEKEDYLQIIHSYFDKFIDDYSYIQTERMKQSHSMLNITNQDPMNIKKQNSSSQNFLISLINQKQQVKQADFDNCLAELSGNSMQKQPDQEKGIFGIYNGLLQWDDNNYKFQYITGRQAKDYFITQSTMFKVQQWMLDANGYLKDISEFESSTDQDIQQFYRCYKQIEGIFKEMYMENIEVLDWKITQILLRMLYYDITCQGLFILFCSGANGKTTQSQTIMTWLGQKQQKISDPNTGEQRYVHTGYISSVKSAILQTSNRSANQHDSGGISELEGCAYACLTELDATVPIVNAQVKSLCGDTNLSTRQAYAKEAHNFINRSFLELQTNNQISFNQGLDHGTVRRLYQYKLVKTFLSPDQYEIKQQELKRQILENPDQEEQLTQQFARDYGVKDETLIQKLCNQFAYIDAGNYYCLMTFQRFYRQHHSRDYTPKILLDSQMTIMQESHKLFSLFMSRLVYSEQNDLLFSSVLANLKGFIRDNTDRISALELKKQIEDYEYLVKNKLISCLYALDKETGKQIHININQYTEYDSNDQYIIILKDYKFQHANSQFQAQQDYCKTLNAAGFNVPQPQYVQQPPQQQNQQQYMQQMQYQYQTQ